MNVSSETWSVKRQVARRTGSPCSTVIMLKSEEELAYYVRIDRIFCIIFGVLFSIGLVANVWVIVRVVHTLKTTRTPVSRRHVLVYVGVLAVTDLALLLNCPFIISDVTNMKWNFGVFLCKWLFGNEAMNKLLTGFIVAALSFDQLITVRKILSSSWRTVSAVWKMIGSFLFVATILLTPVFLYTRVVTVLDEQHDPDNNLTTHAIQKCVVAPPPDMNSMQNGFVVSMFIVGFCFPTFCIGISYGNILHRFMASGYSKGDRNEPSGQPALTNGNRRRRLSIRNRRTVTLYILSLVAVYLCCWTPYWIANVRVSFAPQYYDEPHPLDHLTVTYTLLYIHLLPYLSAVLNPFAYGCVIAFSRPNGTMRPRSSGEGREAIGLMVSPAGATGAAVSRMSIGETWSIESAPVDQARKAGGGSGRTRPPSTGSANISQAV